MNVLDVLKNKVLRSNIKAILPYVLTIMLTLGLRIGFYVAYAQDQLLTCPTADTVRSFVSTLQVMLMMVIIVIVLFTIFFHMFGFISTVAMRLGEFFNERIRFVFELLAIYVFFLWGFDTQTMIQDGPDGCALVDWQSLFTSGPLLFRAFGWLLRLAGWWSPSGS
jgi:hypothetical protein